MGKIGGRYKCQNLQRLKMKEHATRTVIGEKNAVMPDSQDIPGEQDKEQERQNIGWYYNARWERQEKYNFKATNW